MGKKSRIAASRHHAHQDVHAVHALFGGSNDWDPLEGYNGRRDQSYVKNVRPRSEGQKALMEAIQKHSLVFAVGPAGSGKTYLAISAAVEAFEKGKVDRIILSRPAIEAGEKIGYLPATCRTRWRRTCGPSTMR